MLFFKTIALLAAMLVLPSVADAQSNDFTPRPLSMIPPGTQFKSGTDEQPKSAEWSHLISFVRGKLTSGDVEAVSETVAYYADLFNLVMLADVDVTDENLHVLRDVAVGFSMNIGGIDTVVTSDTQEKLGGKLSFIGRGVLDGNMDGLKDVRQIARTSNSMLIDASAVMLRDGQHRAMTVRYFVWVYPANGNLGTATWLLDPQSPAEPVLNEPLRLLPANRAEDRVMNVKKEKFNLLGIPTREAFAMVRMPPGKPFELTESFRQIAGHKTYDAASFGRLTAAFGEVLKGK